MHAGSFTLGAAIGITAKSSSAPPADYCDKLHIIHESISHTVLPPEGDTVVERAGLI